MTFIEKARAVHGDCYDYSQVEYKNAKTRVTIVCREHGPFEQTPGKHLQKQGCPACGGVAQVGFDGFIARARAAHGDRYDYVRESYSNTQKKVTVVCREHGPFDVLPNNHTRLGSGCPKCANVLRGEQQKTGFEQFVEKARSVHGGKYSYSNFTAASEKLTITCPTHGAFEQSGTRHLKGQGCTVCGISRRTAAKIKPVELFIQHATDLHGDRYDYSRAVYTYARSPLEIVCSKHGAFWQTPDAHLVGKGCPVCVNQVSRWELEVTGFINGLGAATERTRKVLGGTEIDIFSAEHKIGVECHGAWFHSTRYVTDKNRHYNKMRKALEAGVRLIQVFDDEWAYRRSAVENLLVGAFGKAQKRHARKLKLVETNSAAVAEFLDKHHVQGAARGSKVFALRDGEDFAAVMVLSKVVSERGAVNAGWELVRYASSGVVVGGASRLFTAFLKAVKPTRVISYSDRRLFLGGMYEKLGFRLVHHTRPNYTVFDGKQRRHKSNYRKDKLAARFGTEAVAGRTEREVCEANNLYRVYDCGLTKWEWMR